MHMRQQKRGHPPAQHELHLELLELSPRGALQNVVQAAELAEDGVQVAFDDLDELEREVQALDTRWRADGGQTLVDGDEEFLCGALVSVK
jgi:hypothetical protein